MTTLQNIQEQAGAESMPYGPADAGIEIVTTFGQYEAEYAAIRQRVGIMHLPQRGLLELTGADVKDFLHRLLTQDIDAMAGGDSRRAFQLNNKGRIVADVIVHYGDAGTWLETDVFDIKALAQVLEMHLFAEDVTIEDISQQKTAFALHGPAALRLIGALCEENIQPVMDKPATHHVLTLSGHKATVCLCDVCGVPGLVVWCSSDHATALYQALLDAAGYDPNAPDPNVDPQAAAEAAKQRRDSLRGRPIGWMAFNTARIEAGAPLYHIDFGADCLPHETGILHDAVSFTKGCYLGQEIVARMESLGHPKRVLVGIRFDEQAMPIAGSEVFDADDRSTIIGAVTSSTRSPLRGNTAIALAMIKWSKRQCDTKVTVPAEGRLIEAVVQGLSFIAQ